MGRMFPEAKKKQLDNSDIGSQEQYEIGSESEEDDSDVENGIEEGQEESDEGEENSNDSEDVENGNEEEESSEEGEEDDEEEEEENPNDLEDVENENGNKDEGEENSNDSKGEEDSDAEGNETLEGDDRESEDEESSNPPQKVAKKIPNISSIQEKLFENYEQHNGKSLYVSFPYTLTRDENALEESVKELCSGVVKVHRSQHHHCSCVVDFGSTEDRAKAIKELNKVEFCGRKLDVKTSKTVKKEFINRVVAKKTQPTAGKQQFTKLAHKFQQNGSNQFRQTGGKKKQFTSTIRVANIPPQSTTADIKVLFPKAIHIETKRAGVKSITASITLPTIYDASNAYKRTYQMGEHTLRITFEGHFVKPNNLVSNRRGYNTGPSKKLKKSLLQLENPEEAEKRTDKVEKKKQVVRKSVNHARDDDSPVIKKSKLTSEHSTQPLKKLKKSSSQLENEHESEKGIEKIKKKRQVMKEGTSQVVHKDNEEHGDPTVAKNAKRASEHITKSSKKIKNLKAEKDSFNPFKRDKVPSESVEMKKRKNPFVKEI